MATFLFKWPDLKTFVLVHLNDDATLSIYPLRSQLAFLYFHHASLPCQPSPCVKKRRYQFWKPVSSPTIKHAKVTLKEVRKGQPINWVHLKHCKLGHYDYLNNSVVVLAKKQSIHWIAHSLKEKIFFLNLFKFNSRFKHQPHISKTPSLSVDTFLQTWLKHSESDIQATLRQIDEMKSRIKAVHSELVTCESALKQQQEQYGTEGAIDRWDKVTLMHRVNDVNHSIERTQALFEEHRRTMANVQKRISFYGFLFNSAKRRYTHVKNEHGPLLLYVAGKA